jgi:hypothetical protein
MPIVCSEAALQYSMGLKHPRRLTPQRNRKFNGSPPT